MITKLARANAARYNASTFIPRNKTRHSSFLKHRAKRNKISKESRKRNR